MQRFLSSLLLSATLSVGVFAQIDTKTQDSPQVPVISADMGQCSADITVMSTKRKPLYKAKIETLIKYGFGGFHRLTLELYTDVDGRARFEGLPERPRQPLAFEVTYEGRSTTVIVHPVQKCHGSYEAIVTDKPVETGNDKEE
ncbi:MAG TPA: hypothetical protein VFP40_06000 [Terriglobales bacterium]|nr:hypothetical protein [Terriglobales bacterium]